LIGLFYENGPIQVNEKLKLERREFHWAEEYSIVFIDQPVGTGYSYVTRVPDSSNSSSSSRMQDPKRMEDQLLAALDQELEEDQTREQKFLADLLQTLKTRDQKDGRVKGKKGVDKSAASFEHMIRTRASRYSNGYVKDQRGVVSDMLIFLDQFYLRFPEVRSKDLYITGESYAGKFVPAVATGILERNKKHTTDCPVNDGDDDDEDEYDMGGGDKDRCRETRPRTEFIFPLKGVAMGNGLSDPVSQVQVHADQCYFAGVITKAHADQMRTLQEKAVREVETGRLLAANQYRLDMFEVFRNATGGLNWYDIRKGSVPNDWTMMELFVNSDPVKDALNVFGPRMAFLKEHGVPEEEIQRIEEGRSRTQHSKDMAVIKAMEGDIMRSSVWMISSLLQQGIKVLIYQGMFDFRDGPAGSHRWVDQLEWPGQAEFLKTERELWKNDMGRLAGYVTQVPGLSRVTILGAGHLAMMDQSKNSLTMISSFIEGKKLGDPTSED
jgi:carboxypeptidase C (cathepsin A)